MSKKIHFDFYCHECEAQYVNDVPAYECPHCGSEDVSNSDFIICDCGKRLYIPNVTNRCECGRYYNGFGQELAPPEDWEPEDRYSLLGPDCPEDFD